MKKIYTLFVIIMLCSILLQAQAPEKFSYQAVVRDNNNQLVKLQEIGMQISILQGSANGTAVYIERHFPKTNENGLVTIEIGSGTMVSGDFSSIDWSTGPYYLKTETDLRGGSNYTISGTSQLLSVPYALYAKTAGKLKGGIVESDPVYGNSPAADIKETDITNWNNKQGPMVAGDGIQFSKNKMGITTVSEKHYNIGDFALGGVIFWVDESGEHGLVCHLKEFNIPWSKNYTQTFATNMGKYGGSINSLLIKTYCISHNADLSDYITAVTNEYWSLQSWSYGDWYIPSIEEMKLFYKAFNKVNQTIKEHNGDILKREMYWSSTESDVKNAKAFHLSENTEYGSIDKRTKHYVRVIRRF